MPSWPPAPTPDDLDRTPVRALVRTRGGLAWLVASAVTAIVCAFLPLADHLGFELGGILAIVAALVAPAVGVSSMSHTLAAGSAQRLRAGFSAGVFSVAVLVVPTLLILLNGVRRPTCDPWGGLVWIAVLAAPSAFLGAAVGAFARSRSGGTRSAVIRIAALEAASLLTGLWTLWAGPAFFLFDHFFGWFPGPLYDETVLLGSQVLTFRVMTGAWAVAAILASADPETQPRATASGLGLGALLAAISFVFGPTLGHRATDASVRDTLGGAADAGGLHLVFPREWDETQRDKLIRDASFRAAQVRAALGLPDDAAPVTVWMYRSPDEKRRLVGAAGTSFAKPWRREVHVHASGFPHPVLRHELVHAYGADVNHSVFNVPGGLFPNSPLIEGFAVAFDVDLDGLTITEWARAMKARGLAPDLSALLSTTGFLTAAPSRAYTYAGAFLRHLMRTKGRDAVLALYASGDLAAAGDPATLVADFEHALDAVPLDPEAEAAAERRYSRPSVFRRNCAREVSARTDLAGRLLSEGRIEDAIDAHDAACAMEPDDPALARQRFEAVLKTRDDTRIDAAARAVLDHPKADPVLLANVLLELGDRAWNRRRTVEARNHYAAALILDVDPATHRAAFVKLHALDDPDRARVLRRLLADGDTGLETILAMDEHLRANPGDALVAYLLGRQLVQRDARFRGLDLLATAYAAFLDDRELTREILRLRARATAELHACGDTPLDWTPDAIYGGPAGKTFAADWRARCQFEVDHGFEPFE